MPAFLDRRTAREHTFEYRRYHTGYAGHADSGIMTPVHE